MSARARLENIQKIRGETSGGERECAHERGIVIASVIAIGCATFFCPFLYSRFCDLESTLSQRARAAEPPRGAALANAFKFSLTFVA